MPALSLRRLAKPAARLLAGAALVLGLCGCSRTPPPPLLEDYGTPRQELLTPRELDYGDGKTTLVLRARFDILAHVMSTHEYDDELGAVAPVDFALAWGDAATTQVQSALTVRQSGRWYWFRGDATVSQARAAQLGRDMANIHMVPDNDEVRRALLEVQRGQSVRLRGFLVDIRHTEAGRRSTSLSRTDSGAGACEILLVEDLEVVPRP